MIHYTYDCEGGCFLKAGMDLDVNIDSLLEMNWKSLLENHVIPNFIAGAFFSPLVGILELLPGLNLCWP